MLKKIKLIFVSLILTVGVTNTVSSEEIEWPLILGTLYNLFWDNNNFSFCPFDFCNQKWPIHLTQDPDPKIGVYEDNKDRTETGYYGFEPRFRLKMKHVYGVLPWSEVNKKSCSDSTAYKDLSILGTPDGYTNFPSFSGNVETMKSFKVNQGVPFNFKANRHGRLTRWFRDSFYFWSFGDGIRYLNKKPQVHEVGHSWNQLGKHTLSSLVYSEDNVLGFSFNIDIDGDFGFIGTNWDGFTKTGSLYLESCDVAEIDVVLNNKPIARVAEYQTIYNGTDYQQVNFSAGLSSDPDGNPLTYTWKYRGKVNTGKNVRYTISSFSGTQYLTLTVSDGGKSDTTTHAFKPRRCMVNCPIMK